MAQPEWVAIFTKHPELTPPGYDSTFIEMLENPRERPARGKSRGRKRETHWPSLKHGAD